jgi:hypothetical protein
LNHLGFDSKLKRIFCLPAPPFFAWNQGGGASFSSDQPSVSNSLDPTPFSDKRRIAMVRQRFPSRFPAGKIAEENGHTGASLDAHRQGKNCDFTSKENLHPIEKSTIMGVFSL